MNKSVLALAILSLFFACNELQQISNSIPQVPQNNSNNKNTSLNLGNNEISNGLKEALNLGISSGIQELNKPNGFFNNQSVKILYPQELQKVDKTLRTIGLGNLADDGIKVLNRAAEDAVSEATPIFMQAINNMNFSDATSILLGGNQSATNYLKSTTSENLMNAFAPKVDISIKKVGADKIWTKIINSYNSIPTTTQKVNPNLTNYITEQTLIGVFKMVGDKETLIRSDLNQRTTPLLQKVFSAQDKK